MMHGDRSSRSKSSDTASKGHTPFVPDPSTPHRYLIACPLSCYMHVRPIIKLSVLWLSLSIFI